MVKIKTATACRVSCPRPRRADPAGHHHGHGIRARETLRACRVRNAKRSREGCGTGTALTLRPDHATACREAAPGHGAPIPQGITTGTVSGQGETLRACRVRKYETITGRVRLVYCLEAPPGSHATACRYAAPGHGAPIPQGITTGTVLGQGKRSGFAGFAMRNDHGKGAALVLP